MPDAPANCVLESGTSDAPKSIAPSTNLEIFEVLELYFTVTTGETFRNSVDHAFINGAANGAPTPIPAPLNVTGTEGWVAFDWGIVLFAT